jgi:hypothetical protein
MSISVKFQPAVLSPTDLIINPPATAISAPISQVDAQQIILYSYPNWYGKGAYESPETCYLDFLTNFNNSRPGAGSGWGTVYNLRDDRVDYNTWSMGAYHSRLYLDLPSLWEIFFSEFFPLTQQAFDNNPSTYTQIFSTYLQDYVLRHIVVDPSGTPGEPPNYDPTTNSPGSLFAKATSTTLSVQKETFRSYLRDVGTYSNPGPYLPYFKDLYNQSLYTDDPIALRKKNVLLWAINYFYQLLSDLANRNQILNKTLSLFNKQLEATQEITNRFNTNIISETDVNKKTTWSSRASNSQSLSQNITSSRNNLQQALDESTSTSQQLLSLNQELLKTYLDARRSFVQ